MKSNYTIVGSQTDHEGVRRCPRGVRHQAEQTEQTGKSTKRQRFDQIND